MISIAAGLTIAMAQTGWNTKYQEHVQILAREMKFDQLPHDRMKSILPKWQTLSKDQKIKAIGIVLKCMSKAESGHNTLAMYRELGIPGLDAVTGLPIVSEGLLQISYQDMKYYKGKCDFTWYQDRKAFIADLNRNQGKQSFNGTGSRSILDPYRNLSCGMQIMRTLADNKPGSMLYAWGRYWAIMRPERPGYKNFVSCLKGEKL
jgi:hypothetical protein